MKYAPHALAEGEFRPTGLLPSHLLRALIDAGAIAAETPIGEDQIQPASVDLRLGATAYRVRASFLPGEGRAVRARIDEFCMHEIDLANGAVLERGCVYIVPLMERLHLSPQLAGMANPKSSTGRLDIFTRTIIDGGRAFESIPPGYQGPLYLEISPRTFSIVVRQGSRLNQLRLQRGKATMVGAALRRLHERERLIDRDIGIDEDISGGIALTVDLAGKQANGPIGYRAKPHSALIDVDRVGAYDPAEYWEPIVARPGGGIILNPDDFYILSSKESVGVPPNYAAEMVAYDTLVGEFRVHYAGFFDPGFGHRGSAGQGARAVLELRSHEVPFVLEDGQIVGRLVFEPMAAIPDKLYGQTIGSSYQNQGLALSKHFRAPPTTEQNRQPRGTS